MRRIMISREEKLRIKYNRMRIACVVVTVLLVLTLYSNYDYMIFKFLIANNYIFTESMDQIYTESIGGENFKGYYSNFDQVTIAAVTEKIRSANQDRYTYLYTPKQYKLSKDIEIADAKTAKIEELTDETVYVYLPNINKITRQLVYKNKEYIKGFSNIILDLRSNYGGMLADSYKIADLFLDKNAVIGMENTRISVFTKTVKASSKKYFEFENITILQNGDTASAAENLTMALKQNLSNVTIIGTQSFGKGIGQITIPIKGGYAIKSTVLLVGTPDGGTIHNTGIAPDVVYDKDDIIDYALGLISN